ncbi:MAG: iron-containing alcohol dehydrogenase [Candidatus Contendobacter sp.]|nr:iron-containing alcohol dehydrogenase [Candidatus Contendobacter sp.]
MLPDYFEFSLPTRVIYGIGVIHQLNDAVASYGSRRALLVTDAILVQAGLAERVRAGFQNTAIEIVATFDQVPPNSTIKTVEACAALGREHGCDLIVGLGGGSVLDTAKVANILMVKGGRVREHMGAYLLGAAKLLPLFLIPTTAGTGSEVTKVAVIADPDHEVKLPFAENQFLPDLAILDPELTRTMPPKLTAMTGMDALTHAIEAYVDKEWSPAADGLALQAIRLIRDHLPLACAQPENLSARGAMLTASCLAGIAFSHSMVGMVHGISHALGGVYHIPHGLANALVLPEVMDYNLESRLDRYADIAEALGIVFPRPGAALGNVLRYGGLGFAAPLAKPLAGLDRWFRRRAAKAGIIYIRTLNRQLAHLTGMPLNLRDAGVKDGLAKLDQVTDTAMTDGSMLYNPREPERAAVARIVRRLHDTTVTPLPVSPADLRPAGATTETRELRDVFPDADTLYQVFGGFFERLKVDPHIGGPLKASGLCVQFAFDPPAAVMTIDARGDEVKIYRGAEFGGQPEVTMRMSADFAHAFWHGQVNLVSALTRRQVVAKGNMPKTLKLLPILKPAYALYPRYLAEVGMADKVMR